MCIMEVTETQSTPGMLEAMAHNTGTILGDFDLLFPVLGGREEHDYDALLERAKANLKAAYADLLQGFTMACASQTMDPEGHIHEQLGNERTIIETVHHATTEAHAFETR